MVLFNYDSNSSRVTLFSCFDLTFIVTENVMRTQKKKKKIHKKLQGAVYSLQYLQTTLPGEIHFVYVCFDKAMDLCPNKKGSIFSILNKLFLLL